LVAVGQVVLALLMLLITKLVVVVERVALYM
jgi:hypothetical protein